MYPYYAELLLKGNENELKEKLLALKEKDDGFIIPILASILNCEMADEQYKLSLWIIDNRDLFPENQDLLDECLKLSVKQWRTDSAISFLEAGANPNQEVIEERNILDVCLNRTDHFYSLERTDLENLVNSLQDKGAQTFLEQKYHLEIDQRKIFETICTYDSWASIALSDISGMSSSEQGAWCKVIDHCHTKSKAPSVTWKKKLDQMIGEIGAAKFEKNISNWLLSSLEQRKSLIFGDLDNSPYYIASDSIKESYNLWKIKDSTSFILKGFVWAIVHTNPSTAANILPKVILSMFQPHFLLGSRDVKLAGATFEALLSSSNGKKVAEEIISQTDHKPAIKKMNTIFAKYA